MCLTVATGKMLVAGSEVFECDAVRCNDDRSQSDASEMVGGC